jgi:hypothetical protein
MALGVGAQLSGDDTGLGEVLRGTVELAQSQGDVAHVAQHVRHLFVVAHLPWASAASCTARSSRLCSSSTAATCSCSSAAAVCRWAVLIFGERHLRQVLAGYAAHYNTAKRDCRFRRGRARRRTDAGVANMQLSEPPYSTVPSSRRGVSNTQRLLQWHHKAVAPPGDCRSDLWFYYELGRRIKDRLAGSTDPRDRPLQDLTWDYVVAAPGPESVAPGELPAGRLLMPAPHPEASSTNAAIGPTTARRETAESMAEFLPMQQSGELSRRGRPRFTFPGEEPARLACDNGHECGRVPGA